MRVLLISGSRLVATVVAHCLQPYALVPQLVELDAALAAGDRPVVILHAPRWDAAAEDAVQRLGDCATHIFVISEAAGWTARLAMARCGAVDGFPEDRAALCLLAIQVQWAVLRGQSGRLELGPLVLDTARGTLGTGDRAQYVTPAEARLLTVLWTTVGVGMVTGLAGDQLAKLARMPEPSVRNHVEYLRRRLGDLVGDDVVIAHERGRGYRLVLREHGCPDGANADG